MSGGRAAGRTVALLRGINVGGHRVKMARLREAFEEGGLENVASFIASGNVVFDATAEPHAELEERLAEHLAKALGFPAPVFLRPLSRLEAAAASEQLAAAEADGFNVHGIFLRREPGADVRERLDALASPEDRFVVEEREVWWLRGGRLTDSLIFADLGRILGGSDHTMRNMKTLRGLVAKFSDGA